VQHCPQRCAGQTIRMAVRSTLLAWALLLLSCGARTDLEGATAPPLPPSYVPLEHCAPPAYVFAGRAFLGDIIAQSTSPQFSDKPRANMFITAEPCVSSSLFTPSWVVVSGFYLDTDETSAACYDECVSRDGCAPRTYERAAKLSASLTRDEAEAFCDFRGGRLPTFAELSLAATAGALSIGQRELLERWIRCEDLFQSGFLSSNCQPLRARLFDYTASNGLDQPAQRADASDVGPYGHFDLFGGLIERTSTQFALPEEVQASWCDSADMSDPGTFGSGNHLGFHPAVRLEDGIGINLPDSFHFSSSGPFQDESYEGETDLFYGARCAYDPERMVEP